MEMFFVFWVVPSARVAAAREVAHEIWKLFYTEQPSWSNLNTTRQQHWPQTYPHIHKSNIWHIVITYNVWIEDNNYLQ